MADIGMRKGDLEIKIAENELLIDEKKFAKKKIEVALLKLQVQVDEYTKSLKDIDEQIKSHLADIKALKDTLSETEDDG